MMFGPVFRAELIRTSRRRRYYALRVVYGLGLLVLIWTRYLALLNRPTVRFRGVLAEDLAAFAAQTFNWFGTVQLVTLLLLVPALCGGVVADEKQRKTLHYLMASRLSGAEIVGDKLASRLFLVGVFVLMGLPVVCLLSLFGGLAWENVAAAYLGTASTVFFAAALATLVSTLARRVRQAVLIAYLAELFWLFGPAIADPACRFAYPRTYQWFGPVNAWVTATSPVGLYSRWATWAPRAGGRAALRDEFLWMVGLQVGVGLVLLLAAVVALRPVFRLQAEGARRVTWFAPGRRRPRWLARPGCGADAMLWKERYFARTDVFTKLVVLPATILLTVFLILASGIDESVRGVLDDLAHGRFGWNSYYARDLNRALVTVSPYYVGLWLLAVAGASASGITAEREEDTWVSLVSTPLTGWEVIRGKVVGAVWGLRGFGGLLGLFWLAGLALGAVHPLGLLTALAVVALLTGSVAALGTALSLRSRTTARALAQTLAILIVLNGGYLLVVIPVLEVLPDLWRGPGWLVGCTPLVASTTLLSYDNVYDLQQSLRAGLSPRADQARLIALGVAVLLGYAVAAVLLVTWSVAQFDRLVGRPRRA